MVLVNHMGFPRSRAHAILPHSSLHWLFRSVTGGQPAAAQNARLDDMLQADCILSIRTQPRASTVHLPIPGLHVVFFIKSSSNHFFVLNKHTPRIAFLTFLTHVLSNLTHPQVQLLATRSLPLQLRVQSLCVLHDARWRQGDCPDAGSP